jgi:2',3'-cyclic-nucleotide 2'-phosphodiesterase (5'-nucleotidase family)
MKKSLVVLFSLLVVCKVSFARQQTETITILHVNDTHSCLEPIGPRYDNLKGSLGGIARAATSVRMYRYLEPNVLLLHAGDAFVGDMFYNTTFGVAELQIMLSMGFDAMTLGNHEFDLTPATLTQAVGAAFSEGSFPLLSANLILEDPSLQSLKSYVSPYTIKDFGKVKVGIFGLTTPATNVLSSPAPAVVDTNIIQIASAMVDTLTAKGCQVIVLLSHLGVMLDQAVASYVPGIHVIVGGHDHYVTQKPIEVTNPLGQKTLIVQANASYLNMGRLKLEVAGTNVRMLSYEMIPIDVQLPADPSTQAIVDQLIASIESVYGPIYSHRIGYVTETFKEVSDSLSVPGPKDTHVGNLVTDAFRAVTHTDIAFEVGGSTACTLWKGPIVAADIFHMVGYGFNLDNGLGYRLATIKISGEALLGGIQFGLTKSADDDNDEFLAQVSGMTYKYTAEVTGLGRTYRLIEAKVGNAPIDPNKMYSVTTNEFVPMFLTMLGIPFDDLHVFTDTTEFQVVTAYVSRLDTLRPKIDGRVQCVVVTSVANTSSTIPRAATLAQNFPNPFNPSTTIAYEIAKPSKARLSVYNMLGQEVAILVDDFVQPGRYSVRFDGSRLSSGSYFYVLRAGDVVVTRRMILMK